MKQDKFIFELNKLDIYPTEHMLFQLEKYYNLLIEYNNKMNLTGIIEKGEVYLKHFYDSLTIIKAIDLNKYESLCDLGSGAGFPGIVLKIFYPNLKITLVDSLNKRINFLNIVINELKLNDIVAIHSRIEDFSKKNIEKFDMVTARAVAPLNILLELGISLVKINGYFISMKGNIANEPFFENSIKILDCEVEDIINFKLPIEESNRCLVKILKKASTNRKYPRNYNEIKKKPL